MAAGELASAGPARRLIACFAAGDFGSDESRRLTTELGPASLLLRAVARIQRELRGEAWDDVRRAIEAAPEARLLRIVAARLLYLLGDYGGALREATAAAQPGVAAATLVAYKQAHALGWHHQARALLEDLLRRTPPAALGEPNRDQARLVGEALAHLLGLHLNARCDAAAAVLLERYRSLAPASLSLHWLAAHVHERCGDPHQALAAVHRALAAEGATPSAWLQAAPILLQIGEIDEAVAAYEAVLASGTAAPPALEALGQLSLWRGDTERALDYGRRLCGLDHTSTAGRRIGAAVQVLRGDCAAALPVLDAILRDDPHDAEAYLWRAEAHLRLHRTHAAIADAQRSLGYAHSFAAGVIHLLAGFLGRRWRLVLDALVRTVVPGRSPYGRGALVHARQEFVAELTAMFPEAQTILADDRPLALVSLLERSLQAVRGNRTPLSTCVRDDGTLVVLPRSTSARVASRHALESIKVASPEEALRRFDELVARLPRSPMPLVHRGELHLWLGRYAEARVDLDAAIALQRRTRWAWYGLACLDLIAGDPERALATCATGIRVMNNTEAPPAFLYRGEAFRVLGRLDEARVQLARSCELNPARLSSWINLGLVHGATGHLEAQRNIFRRFARVAPSLLSEAAVELGADVFEAVVLDAGWRAEPATHDGPASAIIDRILQHVLIMMRGNRSSSCITYFTRAGDLHHVPQPAVEKHVDSDAEGWRLDDIHRLLMRALLRGEMDDGMRVGR